MNPSKANNRQLEWLGWSGLAVALSPVILEWVRHGLAPDTRIFPLLVPFGLIFWARSAPSTVAMRPAQGTLLIAMGLGLEFFGILADAWTLARLALPMTAMGMAMRLGRPSPRLLVLLFFLVPIPTSIVQLTTPTLESFYASAMVKLFGSGLGLDITSSGPLLLSHGDALELTAQDGGWDTAIVLIEGLWSLSLFRAWRLWRVSALAGGALLAVPAIQILAVAIASILLMAGLVDSASNWMRWGFHLALVAAALILFRHWRPGKPLDQSTT